jgi:hypothetical protein
VLLLVVTLFAGCAAGPAPPASAGGSGPPPTGPIQSPTPATTTPTPSRPSEAPSPAAEQPAAVLEAPGGPIRGTLGSWTLDGQGSDSPWLPASALHEVAVRQGRITVRFGGEVAIGAWSARLAPANDPAGETATALGEREPDQPPSPAVVLESPPAGRWVLSVRLDRADGRGDATFYWLLRVS